MNAQPLINSLSFQIAYFHVSCFLENDQLNISVSSVSEKPFKQSFNLNKMVSTQDKLSLWVSSAPISDRQAQRPVMNTESNILQQNMQKMFLSKVESMQTMYHNLQAKMLELHRNSFKLSNMLEQKEKTRQRRGSMQSNSLQDEQKSRDGKLKLEMLNNMLQEKLIEKQGLIVGLQKKVYDRDQLVNQLADKLMTANTQKDDIYSQYEQILQTTIFNTEEQGFERKSFPLESQADRPHEVTIHESVQIKLSSNEESGSEANASNLGSQPKKQQNEQQKQEQKVQKE